MYVAVFSPPPHTHPSPPPPHCTRSWRRVKLGHLDRAVLAVLSSARNAPALLLTPRAQHRPGEAAAGERALH